MAKKTSLTQSGIPKDFESLCAMHAPRPIKDKVDLDNVAEILDSLTALGKLTRDQEDYLETLTTLVESYEASLEFGEEVSGLDALRALLEANDMNATDLSKLLGDKTRSLGSRILRGERDLSKSHIKILCKRFSVSADLFV